MFPVLSSGCVPAPVWGGVGRWSGLHQWILPLHELLEQHTLQLEMSHTGEEGREGGSFLPTDLFFPICVHCPRVYSL